MQKSGVTLNLLWLEYFEQCRNNKELPYQLTQFKKYQKPALLILDEWLLYQLKESEARDLLEIAEARYKKGSMIFCSQFDVPGWRDKIGSPIIADAICDRIVHDSYRIVIECEESMRKIFGVEQSEA